MLKVAKFEMHQFNLNPQIVTQFRYLNLLPMLLTVQILERCG